MPANFDAARLTRRLGALVQGCVSVNDADLLAASMDLWPRHMVRMHRGKMPVLPLAVVWPESTRALQDIVRFANEEGTALVPYGAGSSVVGGATPGAQHIVVDLKRLAKINALNPESLTFSAQTGILGERLERHLQRAGYTQGHFPSSIYCSTLGGWLAARSAGQMSSLYGKIEDQVLGGIAVLGDGTLLEQPPSLVRDPRFEALIGCEGTLGIIAEATVRMHPLPQTRWWRGFDFPDVTHALQCARAWLDMGLSPSVVRIYDPLDTFLHRGTHGKFVPHDRGPDLTAALGAHLPRLVGFLGDQVGGRCRAIIGLEGGEHLVTCDAETVLGIARRFEAKDCGPGPGEAWYARRYAVSYRLSNAFRAGVAADTMEVACLWSRLLPVYNAVRRAGLEAGAQVLAHFSHMYREGGSIYFTFALPAAGGEEAYSAMWEACLQAAVQAGANVSHHHGVGQLKRRAMHAAQSDAGASLDAMRTRFDPARVLNPESLAAEKQMPVTSRNKDVSDDEPLSALQPHGTVAEAEAILSQANKTLGPAAALWGAVELLTAAQRNLLWRRNAQFDTIESSLAGVDTDTFHYLPAPRAAQGPDLAGDLLAGKVQRLWLRTETPTVRHLQCKHALDICLRLARALVSHPAGRTFAVAIQATAGREAVLYIELPREERRQSLALTAVNEVAGKGAYALSAGAPPWPTLPPQRAETGHFTLGWTDLQALAANLPLGATLHIPWIDRVGVVGIALPAQGEAPVIIPRDTARARLSPCTPTEQRAVPTPESAHLPPIAHSPAVAHFLPRAAPNISAPRPDSARAPSVPASVPVSSLRLRDHSAALDNCTYCPKLCRFSCPVAVDSGTETLTPRQLMLTANLDRTERRALSPDTARALWACVDCRGCRSFCDHDNDVATVLQETRAELWQNGGAPHAVRQTLDGMVRQGALPGSFTSPLLADGPQSPAWLWFGCQNTDATLDAQKGILAHARAQFGAVHVIKPAPAARCCGQPLWRWGARDAFRKHASRFVAALGPRATTLIVDDPGCAYTLKNLYPKVGVSVPAVRTAMSLLAPDTPLPFVTSDAAPHDACYARGWMNEPTMRTHFSDAPWARGSVVEGQAGCCGGMLLPHYDAVLRQKVTRAHADDLLGGGAKRIICASPTCSRRLRDVGAPVQDLWASLSAPSKGPLR